MSEINRQPKKDDLPALSPDLVVAEEPGGDWRILQISPPLAQLADLNPEEAKGRSLSRLFPQAVPSLERLAAEAAGTSEPLAGVRLRLGPGAAEPLQANVMPGGLTDDYRSRLVSFRFRRADAGPGEYSGMVGTSSGMGEVFRKIELYAPSDAPVVITGETGTGKELVARALHDRSPRSPFHFIAVNCSAIAEDLLESELFGHEKGAFTGALRTHRGRFERADRGTLFLDEVGDMPPQTQVKLLRVLETGEIERVGGEREIPVDVRVVAATNIPLEQAVGRGGFRADLYHRLSVLRIHLPALRDRPEDIPPLVHHFLQLFSRKYGRRIERLTPEAEALLQSYLWPGNIRELRNVLERVFVETQAEVIGARAFREWIQERQDFSPGEWNLETLERRRVPAVVPPYPLHPHRPLLASPGRDLEAEILSSRSPAGRTTRPAELDELEIRRAVQAAGGNFAAAARILGVHRATLYRYLERLGLHRKDLERNSRPE